MSGSCGHPVPSKLDKSGTARKRMCELPVPRSFMKTLKEILKPLASLKLTVTLLSLAMIVVFTGTSAQKELGIWTVQSQYFHTFIAQVPLKTFFPLWKWGWENIGGKIFLPGGYTLISLLLVNLIAAHALRFKLSLKRAGILLIHGGLILLLVGELVTSVFQVESQMQIEEGQTVAFSYDLRTPELAVIDPTDSRDKVTVIGADLLRRDASIAHSQLPFSIRVDDYYSNSALLGPFQVQQSGVTPDPRPNAGIALSQKLSLIRQAPVTGVAAKNVDVPGAIVTLFKADQPLGTYLLSADLAQPQSVVVDGKIYEIALRFKRYYKPYSLTLKDFRFDRYTGTEMAKNYSSLVQLVDASSNENREVKIWMNHPLRYAGETFYQASFDSRTEKTTVLQVVRNPGWLLPYISCALVSLGLVVHFMIYLVSFLSRVADGRAITGPKGIEAKSRGPVLVPSIAVALCAVFILSMGKPPKEKTPFKLNEFSKVPISYEGRVMPLVSLAENSLRILSGRSTLTVDGKTEPAIRFLADLWARPEKAQDYPVFRIDHPDVVSLLKLDEKTKRFSFNELMRERTALQQQIERVEQVPRERRDLFQKQIAGLNDRISLFLLFAAQPAALYLAMPIEPGADWYPLGKAVQDLNEGKPLNPSVDAFLSMIEMYRGDNAKEFNTHTADYLQLINRKLPATSSRLQIETIFNRFAPFYYSMYLYTIVFLLVCASWMGFSIPLNRAAYWVLLLTLGFHTLGLLGRIYISARPPVTNLYSSAIFIAWGAAVFCALLERIYRNGIGSLTAAVVAGPSLIIAHYLASDSGDTMKMLEAVLDTNFWLATHVIIVTLGYAATFLAGILGCIFIIGSTLTTAMTKERTQAMTRMIFGVICFGLLFSFVGTVLGGIWADQSWGRFWGWDPKENGAVLIVIWNALILHARWGGLVRERGVATLAVVGNIVTAWSWFGTNMMGVGLHSYGFMDSAVFWLGAFVTIQLAIIVMGFLPVALPKKLSS